MCKIFKYSLYISFLVLLITSCSTKKNTGLTRYYHSLTSRYNILFNGTESFKKGMLRLEQTYNDNFSELIPVFLYTDKEALAGIAPEMDRSIGKATKVITMHSLTVKPEMKADKELSQKEKEFFNKKEYNKWVDEAYLLMGKSHFYKMEYFRAKEIFNYILSNYEEEYSVFEAKMWLARLAIEESRFKEAEEILASLERNIELPKKLIGEVQATLADYHIKLGEYEEAIINLKSAIELTSGKFIITRYTYLLAQLYTETGQYSLSSEAYSKVIRMNPPYIMAFNAKISRALSYQSGAGTLKTIEKDLRKMLKDDKNNDYQDQIYYALGNMYFKDNNESLAIGNYKLSLKSSKDNLTQKALTNITLADLYYSKPDYINAQAHYDSAVALINEDYPNYQNIYIRSISLSNLVESINTLNFEDSVLALSYLSESKLNELVDELIEEEKRAEEEKRLKQQELAEQQFELQTNKNEFAAAGGGNAWYFYNPSVKSIGKKDFIQTWGNRSLEDNWRRKNKNAASFGEFPSDELSSDENQSGQSVVGGVVTNKRSRSYYLQFIPFTDSAKAVSNAKIATSLYTMGEIYTDELKDNEQAIESYEELLRRYPDFDNKLHVYYKLYSIAKLEQDKVRLEKYQKKIIEEFPNSNYAKLITNPNYLQELTDQENAKFKEYETTYQLFQSGKHNQVISRAEKAMTADPDHKLYSKYDYMFTVSSGARKDTLNFISDLVKLQERYPASELAENAQLIINYIQNKDPRIFELQKREVARQVFTESPNEDQYFAFVVSSSIQINQLIFNILNFNLDNYDELKLEVKKVNIDNLNNLCLVSKFKNSEEATKYLRQIVLDEKVFTDVDISQAPAFVISETNFKVLNNSDKIEQYILFFRDNY